MFELRVLFYLVILIKFYGCYTKSKDMDVLAQQFFENLKENPKIKESSFNEQVKEFIDSQIENYISLIKETKYIKNHVLTKRSTSNIDTMDTLTRDETGVYILDGFLPIYSIGTSHPKDIKLFTHKKPDVEELYAVSLEVDVKNSTRYLVIYRFIETKFSKIISRIIQTGYKLAVHTTPMFSVIVIIGEGEISEKLVEKPGVYVFDLEEKLTKIQGLDIPYASDVSLWVQNRNLFLGISRKMSLTQDKKINFEVYSPMYQWKGSHFDMVQKIKTYNAQKVLPFSIWDSHYLIYADRRNNKGESNIFSELYKYDIHSGQYVLHQKILTYGVKDVKHFCFFQRNMKEDFLIITNSNNTESKNFSFRVFITSFFMRFFVAKTLILKFVDDYFLPFQHIENLERVKEWLPVIGENGSFALLAVTEDSGLRAFQYNGWNFEDTDLEYSDRAFTKGVNSVSFYLIDNQPLIIVANENDNGKMMNIFEPVFTHKNMLNDFHNEMLVWCEENLKFLQENNKKINKRQTTISKEKQLITEIQAEIDKNFETIAELEQIIENAVKVSETNVILGDVTAGKITLSQEKNTIKSLTSTTVNNVDVVKLLKNVISLNEDFTVQNLLKLKSVRIDNKIKPKFVNEHPAEELIYTDGNNLIKNLTVIGNVVFEKGVKVEGLLQNIKFDKDNILLINTDQKFKGFLEMQNIDAENVTVDTINDFKPKRSISLGKYKEIHVENLTIDGLINNVSITDIERNAIKIFGNQEIDSTKYYFQHLFVNDFRAKTIETVKIPQDLLLINGGNYQLHNSIEFNNLTVKNLIVNENLNAIPVKNGKLDVILVDLDEEQRITGHKIFENVQVLNPIDLQGQIDNKELSKTNPVVRIEKEIVLEGDRVITGNVTVEDYAAADDVFAKGEILSLGNLQDKGLRLDAVKVPVHLNFKQQIKVGDLFVDKVNGIFVSSLVTTGSNEPQIITGWKRIKNDVTITGNATLNTVNDINLEHFENDVLKISGDQVIAGNHFLKSVTTNRINGNEIYLKNVALEDLHKDHKRDILITTPSIKLNSIKVNDLVVKNGTINGHNFDHIINDSVFLDTPSLITGHKTFKQLTIKEIFVHEGMDKGVVPKLVEKANGIFEIQGDIQLPQLSIESLVVKKRLNQIPVDQLDKMSLNKMKLKVYGNVKFHHVVVIGQAFIEDDRINNVSITRMHEDSVKIDEHHEFEAASFENGIKSSQPLSLNGELLGIDLLNLVQSDNANEIYLKNKVFNNDVFVHGNLFFNGFVSGVNFTDLCEFVHLPYLKNDKDLVVEGNAYFLKGPSINYVNNVYLENLKHKFNFSNKRHVVNPIKHFETIIFEGNVIVDQFVNNVDLRIVGDTYFSKSKDQFVTANISFNDGIVFEKDVSAKDAIVLGEIYGIDLLELKHSVLLDGEDQLFSVPVVLKSAHINALNGDEYTLNGYNLETDFMRYDKGNIVTGRKTVNSLKIREVIIDKNINIQGVDILKWFQHSVLKNGVFKISGRTTFKDSVTFYNGLSVHKNMNGIIFNKDTVLTRSYPQVISGKKVFCNSDSVLHFQSLNLKGNWNNNDVKELFDNQALDAPNVRFYSPISFSKSINATNVNIENYRGVNVNELIRNVTNFHQFVTNEKYDYLYDMAVKVENSFSNQAYYLNYYKLIQTFTKTRYAFSIIKSNKKDNLFAIVPKAVTFTIKLLEWNDDNGLFKTDAGEIVFDKDITFMKPLQFNDTTNIYMEIFDDKNKSSTGEKQGNMYIFNDPSTTLDLNYQISNTSILDVMPMTIPEFKNTNCMAVLKTNKLLIYCESVDNKDEKLNLQQETEIPGIVAVEHVVINDYYTIFVVLNNRKFNKKKEAQIEILKYDDGSFKIIQKIFVVQPSSISAIKFKDSYYFAVVSQQVKDAQYPGIVHIRRLNLKTQQFDKYQDIQLQSPFQIKFSILPSDELVLYVLTNTPTQPFIVFVYKGIVGFKEKIIASTLPKLDEIHCFSPSHRHFVYAKSGDNTLLMEASFIGKNHP
ncbi:uncharacterized protein LOC108740183 isoform X2 [Agrilus planipennis]|uniref:Uncharacterized protein LOC108740183 isoform X2 n=1 Tax=Agrilus planipennis TaxID=224129 RepID=A0A7F5R2T5_AGRPL|nr:uncharacterized protein LOC108740183 isoform X2 [Agrilus planipennis]